MDVPIFPQMGTSLELILFHGQAISQGPVWLHYWSITYALCASCCLVLLESIDWLKKVREPKHKLC